MLTPNVTAAMTWTNPLYGAQNSGNEDYLWVKNSVGTIIGWIDETGTPRGTLAGGTALEVSGSLITSPANLLPGANVTLTVAGSNITIAAPTAGPGPQGPQGPTGPQGVAGAEPNGFADVTAYGARAVAYNAYPSTTATISGSSPNAALASASTFQNGDGVVVYGAGTACSLTAPSSVTVQPSQAR